MNSPQSADIQVFSDSSSLKPSRRDRVKQVFENVPHYLASRGVDIRFRKETVATFAETLPWLHLLDVGCGDGSVSLPLLRKSNQITWMDLSVSMLARATAQVREDLADNVRARNEDFMCADFGEEHFDLIISVGVMAHVESPALFLAKLRDLLAPGGRLILEFTDSQHFVGRVGRLWGGLKECVAPAKYQTNKLSFTNLHPLFEIQGFRLVSTFRYSRLPLPGVDRFLNEQSHHSFCHSIFGDASHNTHASWGNEYICLLAAE